MILITHQRSGSEWFLHGLTDVKYNGWEILGDMDRIVGTSFTQFQNISIDARLMMLRTSPKTRAHKIHFSNLRRESEGARWDTLLRTLQGRDDLYLLTRTNTREVLISFMVAMKNNMNFHESKTRLTNSFSITREELERWYKFLGPDAEWAKSLFTFKEQFTYEGLLDGTEVPTTIAWDPASSKVQRRGSTDFIHLIQNYDEVLRWMDEIQVPGNLENRYT